MKFLILNFIYVNYLTIEEELDGDVFKNGGLAESIEGTGVTASITFGYDLQSSSDSEGVMYDSRVSARLLQPDHSTQSPDFRHY